MKRVILTAFTTFVIVLVIPLLVLATGMVDMGASNKPSPIERSLASLAVQRSLAVRAPDEGANPFPDDPEAISSGLTHYAAMCVRCHGGPGLEPEEFAQGLNPPAPQLEAVAAEFSDGELFWLVKHGIRMTGMPAFGATHDDEELWRVVAFVKVLSNLTPEQQEGLSQAAQQGHQDSGAGESENHAHGEE